MMEKTGIQMASVTVGIRIFWEVDLTDLRPGWKEILPHLGQGCHVDAEREGVDHATMVAIAESPLEEGTHRKRRRKVPSGVTGMARKERSRK